MAKDEIIKYTMRAPDSLFKRLDKRYMKLAEVEQRHYSRNSALQTVVKMWLRDTKDN